ncbi:MAG: DEAD/DEAH box helicase family protein [Candidatus Poribacteria bacterium]|nr:DEAD/DEAH box helicase family protein [Candidatus Poribacteria bacterium]
MTPEQSARQNIDQLLTAAGWTIQDREEMNLGASQGVAIREFQMASGPADYLLFIDRKAVGVIEAKLEGATLGGVSEQTERYLTGIPARLRCHQRPLPFGYESTGVETFFRDLRDPDSRSRRLFAFHKPEILARWVAQGHALRERLRDLPALDTHGLRDCQIEAIVNLEQSFSANRPRALIQMATGSGKTYTAVSLAYRLIKFANADRILFLVDRSNLGRQTLKEFQQYTTPDDGRKFTALYNVQHLAANKIDRVSKVCITTIQRLYSMLKGEPEVDEQTEERSLYDLGTPSQTAAEVEYNPDIPISTFDFIITDECHRSIYNRWRPVLEYFDAFIVGLTATPSKQTLGFFNQNLVTEYSHERAVTDGVNVGYEVYRIRTEITEEGGGVEAGYYVDRRDRRTRAARLEQLDEDLEYGANQLDRAVVAPDQIRTVIQTFRNNLFTEIFPGRTVVPKTLIFAKDDSHAEDILHIVREEFDRGNDFCKKITYQTTGERPEDLLASFRNSYDPRIAVTVDMVATGTDIKPLECIIFMRNIRSPVYFEQMKGRGTRTISSTDLRAVTPDTAHKTHFVIVDAVGVCENDKTDSRPFERNRSVPLDKLIDSVALGARDSDTLTTLASRLARLNSQIEDDARQQIAEVSGGVSLRDMIQSLFDATDPDGGPEDCQPLLLTGSNEQDLTPELIRERMEQLVTEACQPFDNPDLRNTLVELRRQHEQTIDIVSQDSVISSGFDEAARERAQHVVQGFKQFIEDNRDELTAIQLIYSRPYGQRHLTYRQVKELADAIGRPPYRLTQEKLWQAYRRLEQSKVKGAGAQKLLTDIISLVRFAIEETEMLEPYRASVNRRFRGWLADQGREYSEEQMAWLEMIRDHIATSLQIEMEDFEYAPFQAKGGAIRVHQLFGEQLTGILAELNERLAA